MAKKRSKDHYRTVNGKLVFIKGGLREAAHDVADEFKKLFGRRREPMVAAPAAPTPPEPESKLLEATVPHGDAYSPSVKNEFDALFGDMEDIEQEQRPAHEAEEGVKIGDHVYFDDVKPGMVLKLTSYPNSENKWKVLAKTATSVTVEHTDTHTGKVKEKTVDEDEWTNGYTDSLSLVSIEDMPAAPAPAPTAVTAAPQEPKAMTSGAEDILTKLQSLQGYSGASIGGFYVYKTYGGMMLVDKKGRDGKPMKASIAKLVSALQSPTIKKKKTQYVIQGKNDAALASALDELVNGPAPKPTVSKTPALGSHPAFNKVTKGMQFTYNGKVFTAKDAPSPGGYLDFTAENPADDFSTTAKMWNSKGYKDALGFSGMAGQSGPKVGDTKIENGVTYVLNANSRWEKVEKASPQVAVAKVAPSQNFPYTQIGPQGGAQPGGAFEDEFGQKWYIKFPESEDHCKNELLALKFYKAILGDDAVPSAKQVVAKGLTLTNGKAVPDGTLGIASKWVDGIKEDPKALAAGAPGVYEGFAVDAWLANWDVAGSNESQYKNLLLTKDGKAIRVDAGGALLRTGLGLLKGDKFGGVVTEMDKLLNPSVNKETAFIYGGITPEETIKSVIKVLEVPDDFITGMVNKFGPGTDADKKALSDKLIARKKYLAKRYPEADRIVNPPPPDLEHLKVDPASLPGMLDYFQMGSQGPTGKWVSATESINKFNNDTAKNLYDLALRGDYTALKTYLAPVINKTTGEIEKHVPVTEHPSSKFLVPFYNNIMDHLQVLAYPGSSSQKSWSIENDAEDVSGLSSAFPGHAFGVTTEDVKPHEVLGFWIKLGQVADPKKFVPAKPINVSDSLKKMIKDSYQHLTQFVKNYLSAVQGGPGGNIGGKKGSITDHNKKVVKDAYAGATEVTEGTTLRRWMGMPPNMLKQMHSSEPGLVFQNPRSQCCGMRADWESSTGLHYAKQYGEGNPVYLEIICAKGARVSPTAGSGSFNEEAEVTSLPGQRYMLLEKGVNKVDGGPKFVLLQLPPDPTYIDNLNIGKVA